MKFDPSWTGNTDTRVVQDQNVKYMYMYFVGWTMPFKIMQILMATSRKHTSMCTDCVPQGLFCTCRPINIVYRLIN